jgi:iron(III) transport system permease protein
MGKGIYVFSTNIYYSLRSIFPPEYGLGFAYSMTLMLLAVVMLLLYQRQLAHAERYTVVTGKGYRPRVIHLGRGRYLGWAFVSLYGIIAILLPILIIIWGSMLPFYKPPSAEALSMITLKAYKTVLTSQIFAEAVTNSVILAFTSAAAIMFLSAIASWFILRTNIASRRLLDFVIFLPYAISGIVMGVGFMILFLSFPNPIYGTIWIIVLAYTINYMPVGSRFTHAAMLQIHKELEEAAWASGANFWQTLRHIWLPLMSPAMIAGGLYVFILSFKVMSIAALLQGPDNTVLPVYLWSAYEGLGLPIAAALSVMMIAVLGIMTVVSRRIGAAMMRGTEAS